MNRTQKTLAVVSGTGLAALAVWGVGYAIRESFFTTDQNETDQACLVQQFQANGFHDLSKWMNRSKLEVTGISAAGLKIAIKLSGDKLTADIGKNTDNAGSSFPIPVGDTFEPVRALGDDIVKYCLPKQAAIASHG